jgi:hypothetical protein
MLTSEVFDHCEKIGGIKLPEAVELELGGIVGYVQIVDCVRGACERSSAQIPANAKASSTSFTLNGPDPIVW